MPSFRDTRIAMLRAETKSELFAIIDDIEARLKSGELIPVPGLDS